MTTQTLPSFPQGLSDRTTGTVLLRNISWETYSTLLDEVGDAPIRLTYDHGLLEIMVPSRRHEQIKDFVGELAVSTMKKLKIAYAPSGSATWQQRNELRGIEADQCYHIQHAADVRGKSELDLAIDPPPDLAIEIDLTSSSIDKLSIYSTLQVPEIWRIDASGQCHMLLLAPSGQYVQTEQSVAVPKLTAELITRYLTLLPIGHSEAIAQFEAEQLSAIG